MKELMQVILVLGLAVCGAGCGDDDDDDDNGIRPESRVVNIFLDKSVIPVGDTAVVNVDVTFDSDSVFDDNENVVVVVQLPNGIAYVNDSSEIQGITGDSGVGAQVTNCASTGEAFLLYDLDENDLDTAENPDGDADARISFTIQGAASTGPQTIQANAGDNAVIFTCGQPFASDAQAAVAVP